MQFSPRVASSRTWARCQILVPAPSTARSETSALGAMLFIVDLLSKGRSAARLARSCLADDPVLDAVPRLRAAYPAAVDEHPDAREVLRSQRAVLGMVCLDHGRVRGLPQVVGLEAQLLEFFVGVQ